MLRPDSNAADVGCNRGAVLREIVRLAPRGRHFAFEPLPGLHRRLRRRFPGVTCVPAALSDAPGTVAFTHYPGMDILSGLARRPFAGDVGVAEIAVRADTLDAAVPPDVRLDFVSIDVEGAEYRVLRGAAGVLRRCRPVVAFECAKGLLDLHGHAPEQVYDVLAECGLEVRPLAGWSPAASPLGRSGFAADFHAGRHAMFVASPPGPGGGARVRAA